MNYSPQGVLMRLLPVLVFILVACSQTPKSNESQIVPVNISEKEILECQQYQKTVIDKAYRPVKGVKGTEMRFTMDSREAREMLAQFDFKKGLPEPRAQLVTNILNQCDEKLLQEFDQKYKTMGRCTLMFSELNYFQSLIYALKNYAWPTDLQLEAKKVALDYVSFFAQGQFPLLNRLIALSVLDEMSVNEIVNKELHSEIRVLMGESQNYVEGLRLKLAKDKGLSCESLDIIREELNYSQLVSEKMQKFLKRI
jgi:hypothetical protein